MSSILFNEMSVVLLAVSSGLKLSALAWVDYALAIWKDADAEFRHLINARELEREIEQLF